MRTTRRDLLKYGAGIAGILASGNAPAYIKSIIAADQIRDYQEVDSGPTTAEYVQDGLIAMYDGIDNNGVGRHSATSFPINLVSGVRDIPFPSQSTEITPTSFIISNTSKEFQSYALPKIDDSFPYATLEVNATFLKGASAAGNLDMWFNYGTTATASSINFYMTSSTFSISRGNGYGNYNERIQDVNTPLSGVWSSIVSIKESDDSEYNLEKVYKNGSCKFSKTRTDWTFNSFYIQNPGRFLLRANKGSMIEFRNIRLYDRVLTDEEIAHNYEVDTLRFN